METDGGGVRELQITMETDDPAPGLGLDNRFSDSSPTRGWDQGAVNFDGNRLASPGAGVG